MTHQPAKSFRQTAWPHAPIHKLAEAGTYFVTAATYNHLHHFAGADRLGVLHRGLLQLAQKYKWHLEAWAVFSNHYHFVAHSPAEENNAESLAKMLTELHSATARWVNRVDSNGGRQVWHNFRESKLTFKRSYLARLNYTHQNAVKHGLVPLAALYPWCSAGWFEQTATAAQIATIYGLRTESVNIYDEFSPVPEW